MKAILLKTAALIAAAAMLMGFAACFESGPKDAQAAQTAIPIVEETPAFTAEPVQTPHRHQE